MARRSRDASRARSSRVSSSDERRHGAERNRSASQNGISREDQEDREHRAFHARVRARQAVTEDRDRDTTPPRR